MRILYPQNEGKNFGHPLTFEQHHQFKTPAKPMTFPLSDWHAKTTTMYLLVFISKHHWTWVRPHRDISMAVDLGLYLIKWYLLLVLRSAIRASSHQTRALMFRVLAAQCPNWETRPTTCSLACILELRTWCRSEPGLPRGLVRRRSQRSPPTFLVRPCTEFLSCCHQFKLNLLNKMCSYSRLGPPE